MQNLGLDQFIGSLNTQKELTLDDLLSPIPNDVGFEQHFDDNKPSISVQPFIDNGIQINVHPEHQPLPPQQLLDPFMLSPNTFQQLPRNRSNSVASSVSITLDGLRIGDNSSEVGSEWGSEWGSDYGSNYGALSPFPGAQVVQVPSPWIHAINSPGNVPVSPMLIPTADNFQLEGDGINYVQFDDYLNQFVNPNVVDPFVSQSPQDSFLQQQMEFQMMMNKQISQSPSNSFLQQQMELSNVFPQQAQVPSQNQVLNQVPGLTRSTSNETMDKTSVPDGKFWNMVKKDGQTLYQCPWTDPTPCAFTRPYNLKSHYRGHLGEKPFGCDVPHCGATFARKHDLKRHVLSHSEEKKHKCSACGKAFTRHDALARHLKPADGKESPCVGK